MLLQGQVSESLAEVSQGAVNNTSRMIAQGHFQSTTYALSLKTSSLSVSINRSDVVACDRAGRLYSVYRDSRHHRRSLSGPILQKWTAAERHRQWLDATEADELVDWAADQFHQFVQALGSPSWEWITPPDNASALADLIAVGERAARFDSAAARWDATRFAEVYSPIGILPPDQYLALVLQATTGCSFNTCTFCDLYHQPFRSKTPAEFRQHLEQVRAYLGESLTLRQRSIFLGAANALALPMARLRPIFEIVHEEPRAIPNEPSEVYAFLDAFTGTRKTVSDYQSLAALGLRRVYIGLESGHDPLLTFVRKPGHARDAVETAQAIKTAGINVGVIVMIGLGGDRYADGHVADTLTALNSMSLGPGDLVYLSDLVEEPGTPYPHLAQQQDICALTVEERTAQREVIRQGLQLNGAKVSNYDVREFVY